MKPKAVAPCAACSRSRGRVWRLALLTAWAWGGAVPLVHAQGIAVSGDVSPQPPVAPVLEWNVGASLYVGRTGAGALTVRDGRVVTGAHGYVGEGVGSSGLAIVAGVGTRWNSRGQLYVGEFGSGLLIARDQGQVLSRYGNVGNQAGSTGQALVTGAGTRWDIDFDLFVGTSGTGELRIENGALVASNYAIVALDSTGRGTVVVTGVGSAWRNASDITIGDSGAGVLQVLDAGLVQSATALLGAFAGGTGDAIVAGQGALWETQALTVGVGGSGRVQLRDGGRMLVRGRVVDLATFGAASGAMYVGAMSSNPGDAVAAGSLEAAQLRFGEGSASLNFNHLDRGHVFAAALSSNGAGTHQINHYAGETRLTGDSSGFRGETRVWGGTLSVEQQLGGQALVQGGRLQVDGTLGGPVRVAQAGTLGGAGTVQGAVDLSGGAVLAGVQGQTLTVAGPLRLDSASQVSAALGTASSQALFRVGGDLVLDGSLQLSDLGGFGAGIYRLFDYGGALTDRGLQVGTTPAGVQAGQLRVQTAVAGQVNLSSVIGVSLNIWDGGRADLHDNGVVDGGAGRWRADGENWTETNGQRDGPFQPNPGFAVFQGAAGTVTVDRTAGAIGVTGMQFASDGYQLDGDAIDLQGAGGETLVRVGDGSAVGAQMGATVLAPLAGASTLVKSDLGTLVLGGRNTYRGGTRIDSGVLAVSSDENLGATLTGIALNGGTLRATASFDTGRSISLRAATAAIDVSGAAELGVQGEILGSGRLVKQGLGTLRLDHVGNAYTGATDVMQGRLLAGAANVLSPVSAYSVAAGAVLDLAGRNQTLASLHNSGHVTLAGPAGSTPGTVLKLTGPYVGNSGTLGLATVLQGPGSASDLLLLSGSQAIASGRTTLVVTNAGGMGAPTDARGIAVVATENGARLQPGAFALANGHVDAGAYEYQLRSDAAGASLHAFNADGSQVSYRAEASLITAVPAQLRQSDLVMLGHRRQRFGEDAADGTARDAERRTWGRLVRSDARIAQQGTVSAQSRALLIGFQAGLDLWRRDAWTAGLYVGQLDGDMQVQGFAGGQRSRDVGFNRLRSRYLGLYASYQNAQDLYVDAVLQAADYRSEINTQDKVWAATKGRGWLASVELGQPLALQGRWQLEPQAQLVYRRIDLDATVLGTTLVRTQADDDWLVRLGARLKGYYATSAGVLQPSVQLNVFHASRVTDVARFITSSTTTMIPAQGGHTSTELSLGGSLQLDPMTSVYAELGKLWANGGDTRVRTGVQATLGLKRRW